MSDPGVFSQHQAMERESTGIVTPSGTFHQHVPAGYMDFPKVINGDLKACSLVLNGFSDY